MYTKRRVRITGGLVRALTGSTNEEYLPSFKISSIERENAVIFFMTQECRPPGRRLNLCFERENELRRYFY